MNPQLTEIMVRERIAELERKAAGPARRTTAGAREPHDVAERGHHDSAARRAILRVSSPRSSAG
jgi:hypothetical protein